MLRPESRRHLKEVIVVAVPLPDSVRLVLEQQEPAAEAGLTAGAPVRLRLQVVGAQSLPVAAITDDNVQRAALVPLAPEHPVAALVCMHMACHQWRFRSGV